MLTKKEKVLTLITLAVALVLNIIDTEFNLVTAIIGTVTNTLVVMSYIVLLKKPLISILLLLASQLSTFIHILVEEKSIREAIDGVGVIGITIVIAFLLWFYLIDRKVYTSKEKIKIRERIKNISLYDRIPLKIPVWAKIMLYSMLSISLTSLAKSESFQVIGNSNLIRFYTAVVLLVPIYATLGILTTSELAYELYIIKVIAEATTVYILSSLGEQIIAPLIWIVIEVVVIVYTMLELQKQRKGKTINERKQDE